MASYRPAGVEETLAWRWIAQEAAILFAVCAAIFYGSLAALPGPIEGDTLFQYRMARLLLERGPWVSIDGLPYTVLGAHGTDQNWLFHVIIAPLTLLGEGLAAIDLATAIAAAAMVAAFLVILRRNRVPYAPLICLLMVTAGATLQYRFLLLRGQDLAVPISAGTPWPRPDSAEPGSSGMCASGFGLRGSVTSTIEAPLSSTCPDPGGGLAIPRMPGAAGGGR